MSPHIKSVDDVVVLGMNLSKFSKPTQFFICVSGVFMFYLIYGYLQVNAMNLGLRPVLPTPCLFQKHNNIVCILICIDV